MTMSEEIPTLKVLAFEAAARRNQSLPDFVTMWEYAAEQPQNARVTDVYKDILSRRERETRSRMLDYRKSFYDDRRNYLHWATLDTMMNMGYTGFVTIGGDMVIRYDNDKKLA